MCPLCSRFFILVISFLVAPFASAAETLLTFDSQPGDYIGQGVQQTWTETDGTFSAEKNDDNGVSIAFDGGGTSWNLDFAAAGDVELTPGTYENATRFPSQEASAPGLSVSGSGRSCNTSTGSFEVHEIVYGAGAEITAFAASFTQYCEDQTADALHGLVLYQSDYQAPGGGPYSLQVTVNGTGAGTVTAPAGEGGGIDCGTACDELYPENTAVTLTATPDADSEFAGWSGDCSGSAASVEITLDAAQNCTATFNSAGVQYPLQVTVSGVGSGTVTAPAGSGGGIDCRTAGIELYPENTAVTLTATPAADSEFAGWRGDCSGTAASVEITLDAAKTCLATFSPVSAGASYSLQVTVRGTGSGTITAPAGLGSGIDCGAACNESYPENTAVTLTATPDAGSQFAGWIGDCSGSAAGVTITLDADKNCSAAFTPVSAVAPGEPVIDTAAGTGTAGYSGDSGLAREALLNRPWGLAVDPDGNVYLADRDNHMIRKLSPGGVVERFAGTGEAGFTADQGIAAANAALNYPSGVALSHSGLLYVADTDNHRIQVFDTVTGTRHAVLGSGAPGFDGDGGSAGAAQFNFPLRVTVDGNGNLFIADTLNHRIRKVDINGTISTYTGTGASGYSGDGGPAAEAKLNLPAGLVTDSRGNLYIADQFNHRVRMVDTNGIISTYAGTGVQGYSGDGGRAVAARLNSPYGLSIDERDALFISEANSHVVRKVALNGIISTVAGTAVAGFSGDGGDPAAAQLNGPLDVEVRGVSIYIADTFNHRLRVVDAVAHTDTAPPATIHLLAVGRVGSGDGIVIAPVGEEDGIDCGTNCSETYAEQSEVTLAATAEAGSFFVAWEGDCSGRALTSRLTITGPKQCAARFEQSADEDGDGVPDAVESAGPNGGDGNGDGEPDRRQANVATLRDDDGHYVSVEVSTNCVLGEVLLSSTLPARDPPYTYTHGVLRLEAVCTQTEFIWHLHGLSTEDLEYRQYAPSVPGDPATARWVTPAGIEYGSKQIGVNTVPTVEYTLEDGQDGDDTGLDGSIVTLGGIADAHVNDIIEFAQTQYQVREDARVLTLNVERKAQRPSTDVGVSYTFEDGTARRYMGDYSATPGILQWSGSDTTPRTIVIVIIDNPHINSDRQFSVVLGDPVGGAAIGANRSAIVTIVNEDTETGVQTCPRSGNVETACNAAGLVLAEMTVGINGHVTGGMLAGELSNFGWVSNLYLDADAVLDGGVLAGNLAGFGSADDVHFHGNVLSNLTLGGEIDGGFGMFYDIGLGIGARMRNGTLHGRVQGEMNGTALLENLAIAPDTILSQIRLGDHLDLPWERIRFGAGVSLAAGTPPPLEDLRLVENLPDLPPNNCNGKLRQPSPLDLSQDDHNSSQFLLSIINQLPFFQDNAWAVQQDRAQGYLWLEVEGLRFALHPWQMSLSSGSRDMRVGDRQSIQFHLGNGLALHTYSALQDPCALYNSFGGIPLDIDPDGSLRVRVSRELAYTARPDLTAWPVAPDTPVGAGLEPSPVLADYVVAYYVFDDPGGQRRRQYLYPLPASLSHLAAATENLYYHDSGEVGFALGGHTYRGIPDYVVSPGTGPIISSVRIVAVDDRNGDGIGDYLISYPNRDQQILFGL